jgi:hypothetical protein
MKWVPLYALTALVIGLYSFYQLMSMIYGAPVPVLSCISLLGSVTLLVAAFLLPFRFRTGARVGFWGSILSWVFYAPLIFASLITPLSTWREIRFDISFRDYVPVVGKLLGPVLLILCTINSIILLSRNPSKTTAQGT